MNCGMPLYFDDGMLRLANGEKAACLSKQKRDELQVWAEKGYHVQAAKVNFIVAWKGMEDTEETAVVLPEIILKRLN